MKEDVMKKQSYFFLGMAIHAFTLALLQTAEMSKITPGQQGLAGVFFLGIMAITIIGKR